MLWYHIARQITHRGGVTLTWAFPHSPTNPALQVQPQELSSFEGWWALESQHTQKYPGKSRQFFYYLLCVLILFFLNQVLYKEYLKWFNEKCLSSERSRSLLSFISVMFSMTWSESQKDSIKSVLFMFNGLYKGLAQYFFRIHNVTKTWHIRKTCGVVTNHVLKSISQPSLCFCKYF